MQVHYDEGIANRIDPESCAVARKGLGEALTGEHIGQPLSREMNIVLGADTLSNVEGNTNGRAPSQALGRPGVVADPGMCGRFLRGNREISRPANGGALPSWSASERRGAVLDDEQP